MDSELDGTLYPAAASREEEDGEDEGDLDFLGIERKMNLENQAEIETQVQDGILHVRRKPTAS